MLIVLAAYFGQRRLMYFPDRARTLPARSVSPASRSACSRRPTAHASSPGTARRRPGQPTLLYFHGNGGSLADRAERIRRFMAEGWGVYMMTYRGYGGGTGNPTEIDNVADARLAYGALVLEGVAPSVDHSLRGVARHRHCRAHCRRSARSAA